MSKLKVCSRAERILEDILDFNWEISPLLDLFLRWRQLFPRENFGELSETIRKVYVELIKFWVDSIRFLRGGALGIYPSLQI